MTLADMREIIPEEFYDISKISTENKKSYRVADAADMFGLLSDSWVGELGSEHYYNHPLLLLAHSALAEYGRYKALMFRDETGIDLRDILPIMALGAAKYGANNWLENGHKMDHRSNHSSIARHLLSFAGGDLMDEESRHHHLLHVATRALMMYTLYKRGISHG